MTATLTISYGKAEAEKTLQVNSNTTILQLESAFQSDMPITHSDFEFEDGTGIIYMFSIYPSELKIKVMESKGNPVPEKRVRTVREMNLIYLANILDNYKRDMFKKEPQA